MSLKSLLTPPMAVASLALFLAAGAPVVWAHGGDATVIHACVTDATGAIRLVGDPTRYGSPNTRCRAVAEHALDWNVAGGKGLPRAPGPAGPQGTQGLAGPAGQASAAGELTWYRSDGYNQLTDSFPSRVIVKLNLPGNARYVVDAQIDVRGARSLWVDCKLRATRNGGPMSGMDESDSLVIVPLGVDDGSSSGDWTQSMSLRAFFTFGSVRGGTTYAATVRCHKERPSVAWADVELRALRIGATTSR